MTVNYFREQKGAKFTYTCECAWGGRSPIIRSIPGVDGPELSWEAIEKIPIFIDFVNTQVTLGRPSYRISCPAVMIDCAHETVVVRVNFGSASDRVYSQAAAHLLRVAALAR